MKSYFGAITIGAIRNRQAAFSTIEEDAVTFIPLNENNIRFVCYPDCQQLIIWLTHPGIKYSTVQLVNQKNNEIIEDWPVTDRLSGSIQILWDTLPIAPGLYTININGRNGCVHEVDFEKHEEGENAVTEKAEIVFKEEKSAGQIVYKDGFGKVIENEDLVLREKVIKDIGRRFSRRIEYIGSVRSGTVIYIDNETRIEFINEMGGGNCMVYIEIPTEEQWETQTKTPLAARKEILEFMAETVRAEQASNCNYKIKDNMIGYYYQ